MKKLLVLILVLTLSLGLSFPLTASSAQVSQTTIKVMPRDGKLVTPDGQELIPLEVGHVVSLEEEIASLANLRIGEITDLPHFEEKANSPLRSPSMDILGVETSDLEKLDALQGETTIKVVKYSPATVKPQVWNLSFLISGSLEPNTIFIRGPYSGYLYLVISVNWAPSNQVLYVGFKYLDSPNLYLSWLSNGSGTAGFSLDFSRSFQTLVYNPSPNSQPVNYEGTVTLFFYSLPDGQPSSTDSQPVEYEGSVTLFFYSLPNV